MPQSLICSCGAKLEFDDKFAGQTLPCPDCDRPVTVPALKPVTFPRPHPLAISALAVGLVGFFTLAGSLAAIVAGVLSRRAILRQPERWSGASYASWAMVVGTSGVALTTLALVSPEVLFLEMFFREFEWSQTLSYDHKSSDGATRGSLPGDVQFSYEPPTPSWGRAQNLATGTSVADFILMDPRWDAHIAVQKIQNDRDDEGDAQETVVYASPVDDAAPKRAVNRFVRSELVHMLGRLSNRKLPRHSIVVRSVKANPSGSGAEFELLVNARLSNIDRTFILSVHKRNDGEPIMIAAGTRHYRFAWLEPTLRQGIASFKFNP